MKKKCGAVCNKEYEEGKQRRTHTHTSAHIPNLSTSGYEYDLVCYFINNYSLNYYAYIYIYNNFLK